MLLWTIIKVAIRGMVANLLRSVLAMLGIIIGVAAVIAMLALGAGAQQQVIAGLTAMGTNLLVVRPGQAMGHGVRAGERQNLTVEDAEAIARQVPGVKRVAPVVSSFAQLKYFNRNTNCMVTGASASYLPIRNFAVARGSVFTAQEEAQMARVALLGPVAAEKLFGKDPQPGEVFKLKGMNFLAIGILAAKGDQGWFNPDDQAIIPYTTAMKCVQGVNHLREIDVQIEEGAENDAVIAAISKLLRQRHRLPPEADDDFNIRNQAELLEMVTSYTQTFTIMLGGIAGISLLVGGIGIMNIMLVTVAERTREIGIRKAIGARERDILAQFLVEAMILTGLGGAAGVALGIGAAFLIGYLSTYTTLVGSGSVFLAFSVSVAVGIFFGLYPAVRAARLDPIEALRYE